VHVDLQQQPGVPFGVDVPRQHALGALRPVVLALSTQSGRDHSLVDLHV
jgi:hypothetical protein